MPTYVYGCDACGHRFEQFQKFSDDPIKVCPECGQAVRRIFQPAGIVFKGSGWHITDYKRSGNGGGDAKGEGKSDAKGEGKSDAKGEGKGDTASAKPAESKSDSPSSSSGDSSKPAPAAS